MSSSLQERLELLIQVIPESVFELIGEDGRRKVKRRDRQNLQAEQLTRTGVMRVLTAHGLLMDFSKATSLSEAGSWLSSKNVVTEDDGDPIMITPIEAIKQGQFLRTRKAMKRYLEEATDKA